MAADLSSGSLMIRAVCTDRASAPSRSTRGRPSMRSHLASGEIAQQLRSLGCVDHILFIDPQLLQVALKPLAVKIAFRCALPMHMRGESSWSAKQRRRDKINKN